MFTMKKEFEFDGKTMGTEYSIAIVCNSQILAETLYEETRSEIEIYEKQFSRFSPVSELSQLNRKRSLIVSKVFFEVTTKAYELFKQTHGIFNPLVDIARFGYNKNYSELPSNNKFIDQSTYNIDFSSTRIDRRTRRISLVQGQKLDFGGFLKGYLAEQIAEKLFSVPDVSGVIVNLGGDICTKGLDENGNEFEFLIYNPIMKNNHMTLKLRDKSLATSGTYKRVWSNSGKNMHHILDSSGKKNPDNNIVSASVIHKSGAGAEAYAKVFLSIEYTEALKILNLYDLGFVIIRENGQVITNNI